MGGFWTTSLLRSPRGSADSDSIPVAESETVPMDMGPATGAARRVTGWVSGAFRAVTEHGFVEHHEGQIHAHWTTKANKKGSVKKNGGKHDHSDAFAS